MFESSKSGDEVEKGLCVRWWSVEGREKEGEEDSREEDEKELRLTRWDLWDGKRRRRRCRVVGDVECRVLDGPRVRGKRWNC